MGLASPLVFLCGVLMGTGSTITVKLMYGLKSVGLTGESQFFEKPLFTTFVMFVAMMLALPVHFMVVAWNRRATSRRAVKNMGIDEAQPINGSISHSALVASELAQYDADNAVPWRTYFLLAIPSSFDLLGTALASIGLLFTTVSIYQLVRCSVIIVCALLKGTVLGAHLNKVQWTGVAINTLAMILVSSTSFFPDSNAGATGEVEGGIDRDPRIGIMFILMSCMVQGSQYVFEERVMTVDNAPPLVVVGMEGVWGTLMMLAVVFPWAYLLPGSDVGGCLENIDDSLTMLSNSRAIQWVLFAFTLTVFAYNIFCIYVTYLLSSVWHAILDNFRPIAVWMTDLAIFYWFTEGTFGERWTKSSWIELIGMLVLFLGTAVYNGTVRLPFMKYDEIDDVQFEEIEDGVHKPHVEREQHFDISSPMLTMSPLITRQIRTPRNDSPSHSHLTVNGHSYGSTKDVHFAPPHLALNSGGTNLSRSHEERLSSSYSGGGYLSGSPNSHVASSRATSSKHRSGGH